MVTTETSRPDRPGNTGDRGSALSRASAGLMNAVLRRVGIRKVSIGELDARTLGVDEIEVGSASVERMRLADMRTQVQTGQAFLNNVRTIVNLDIHVNWQVNLLFTSPSDSFRLGSIPIPFDVGDVLIPELDNLDIQVPSAQVEGSTLSVQPIRNLTFNGGTVADVSVSDIRTPVAGFALDGLSFDSISLSHIGVPDASIGSVDIGSLQAEGLLTIPRVETDSIGVSEVQVPRISSNQPISIQNADAQDREITLVNIGLLRVSITIKPSLDMNIGSLTLDDMEASSTIRSVELDNTRFSLAVNGISMSDVGARGLRAEQFSL